MSEELEKTANHAAEASEGSREGYQTGKREHTENDFRAGGRPQRPRIRTTRTYSSDYKPAGENGFRPEGFGSNLQNSNQTSQGGYRPRHQQNGYQQRQGYQQRPAGGYRPRYNQQNEEGGYQPRQGYQP